MSKDPRFPFNPGPASEGSSICRAVGFYGHHSTGKRRRARRFAERIASGPRDQEWKREQFFRLPMWLRRTVTRLGLAPSERG